MTIHTFTDSQGIQRQAEIHDNINSVELLQVEKEFEEFDLGRVVLETLDPQGETATADDLDAPDPTEPPTGTLNPGI